MNYFVSCLRHSLPCYQHIEYRQPFDIIYRLLMGHLKVQKMKAIKVERESWPWWNHSHWAEGSYRELGGHSYSQRCPPPSQSHRFRCPRTCKISFMVLSMDFLVKKLVFKTFRIFHIWIRFICLLIGKSFCGPAGFLSNTVVFFSSSTFFSFIIFFSPVSRRGTHGTFVHETFPIKKF